MIITEIQYFFSKIIRFQAIFKDTVEFTCALEFKISSQLWFFLPLLLSSRHSIVSILVLGLYTIPAVLFLKLSCSSFTIHLSYFIAQQQACIQIAATIYTQACPRTSLFCFLLYQLSLWWVKYRAQPEATNPRNHAGTQRTMVNRNKLR